MTTTLNSSIACAKCGAICAKTSPNRRRCSDCSRYRRGNRTPAASAIPATKASKFSDSEWSYEVKDTLTLNEYRRVRDEAPVVHFVAAS